MEENETNKKIVGLTSTIVVGIFLGIVIILMITLLTMNLKEALEQFNASTQEAVDGSEDPAAATLVVAFAGIFGIAAIFLIHYFMVFFPFIIALILLIPVIKNVKHADNKGIKITNFVYLGLLSASLITCIIKFVLFSQGIA